VDTEAERTALWRHVRTPFRDQPDALRAELGALFPGRVIHDTLFHTGAGFEFEGARSVLTERSRYRVDVVGVEAHEKPAMPHMGLLVRADLLVVFWRMRVWELAGPEHHFVDFYWAPGWPKAEAETSYHVRGDAAAKERAAELARLHRALEAVRRRLRVVQRRPRGRSSAAVPWAEFEEQWRTYVQAWRDAPRRRRPPTRSDFATRLKEQYPSVDWSDSTVGRYVKDHGRTWPRAVGGEFGWAE
jgi:hypothetical protein